MMWIPMWRWCVYTHSVAGEVVYVGMGQSDRPFKRHDRTIRWEEVVCAAGGFEVTIIEWFERVEDAAVAEADLIRALRPRCNAVQPSGPRRASKPRRDRPPSTKSSRSAWHARKVPFSNVKAK